MNNINTISFIEGIFNADEAKEILLNIFSSKIQFHELKNFSSIERFGQRDESSCIRIPELKLNVEKIKNIIEKAKSQNKQLKIISHINIELTDEED